MSVSGVSDDLYAEMSRQHTVPQGVILGQVVEVACLHAYQVIHLTCVGSTYPVTFVRSTDTDHMCHLLAQAVCSPWSFVASRRKRALLGCSM